MLSGTESDMVPRRDAISGHFSLFHIPTKPVVTITMEMIPLGYGASERSSVGGFLSNSLLPLNHEATLIYCRLKAARPLIAKRWRQHGSTSLWSGDDLRGGFRVKHSEAHTFDHQAREKSWRGGSRLFTTDMVWVGQRPRPKAPSIGNTKIWSAEMFLRDRNPVEP